MTSSSSSSSNRSQRGRPTPPITVVPTGGRRNAPTVNATRSTVEVRPLIPKVTVTKTSNGTFVTSGSSSNPLNRTSSSSSTSSSGSSSKQLNRTSSSSSTSSSGKRRSTPLESVDNNRRNDRLPTPAHLPLTSLPASKARPIQRINTDDEEESELVVPKTTNRRLGVVKKKVADVTQSPVTRSSTKETAHDDPPTPPSLTEVFRSNSDVTAMEGTDFDDIYDSDMEPRDQDSNEDPPDDDDDNTADENEDDNEDDEHDSGPVSFPQKGRTRGGQKRKVVTEIVTARKKTAPKTTKRGKKK